MFVDLHVHTCLSDGSDTVAQVLKRAQENGLSVIAITDHNTLAAYEGGGDQDRERTGYLCDPRGGDRRAPRWAISSYAGPGGGSPVPIAAGSLCRQ